MMINKLYHPNYCKMSIYPQIASPIFMHWVYIYPRLDLKAYAWQPGAGQAILAPCWPYVGPMLAYVGPMLAHVEPSWELCRGHVWAIYVETILRCQFFRPRPPPGAQNHVKTKIFEYRQDKICGRRRARNTVKTNVFYTVNYRSFSRGGVDMGWTRGGSAAGAQRL